MNVRSVEMEFDSIFLFFVLVCRILWCSYRSRVSGGMCGGGVGRSCLILFVIWYLLFVIFLEKMDISHERRSSRICTGVYVEVWKREGIGVGIAGRNSTEGFYVF